MGSRRLQGRSTRRPTVAVALALAAVLVIAVFAASCGGSGSSSTTAGGVTTTAGSSGGGAEVVMKGFAFDPASVTIKVGETVKWTNQDGATHTVVADNGEFKSGDLAQGDSYTFTFSKAGTYPFHCSIHPSMKGTVIVQ